MSTTPSTPGWVTRWRPTSSSGQRTSCTTSSGTPAACTWRTISAPHAIASGAGLSSTALPAARAATTPFVGMAIGKFHGPATRTTPSGSACTPRVVRSSRVRVHAADQRAKSIDSDTSLSPSRTVLPVSWAITAIVRPRSAAITSATRFSTARRSAVVIARQRSAPSRARATSSSIPTVVVTSGGSSCGRSPCRCAAIHSRLPGRVKSVSGSFVNGASASNRRCSVRRSCVRRGSWRPPAPAPRRASKRSRSRSPQRRADTDREQRPQEVLRSGVLVEPSRQVGDARREVRLADDRRVQQHAVGVFQHGA